MIAPSALKHGLSEAEVLHAYRNPIRVWDLGDGFTMIGANAAAIILEIGSSKAMFPSSLSTRCGPARNS